jgi:Fic-DOC domain mobile mystery protein B
MPKGDMLFGSDDEANTPLTAEEREQLIPTYITLRHELNEAEQINISAALTWLEKGQRDLLDQIALRALHKRMFGKVWRWAGQYRNSPRNIGIEAYQIPTAMAQAIADARYWSEHQTYAPDEVALRFSHRLVAIHPFPNGNGRFSRLVGDQLIRRLGGAYFTWGRTSLVNIGETRKAYIAALKAADNYDMAPLLAFARS